MNEGPTNRASFVRRHARALLASFALIVGFAWVLQAGALPLLPPAGALANVDVWGFALGAAAFLVHALLRLVRVHFILAPIATIGLRRIVVICSICLGLITFLPFRLGEIARPAMLREKGKLSGWAVTGTVGAERIIDGVVISSLLLFGLMLAEPREPLPDHIGDLPVPAALVPRAAQVATLAFGAAFLAMAVFFWRRALARRVTEAALGIFSRRFATRVADAVERVSDGLRFLTDPRSSGPFLAFTLAAMLLHTWALQLMAHAVGLTELDFAQCVVLLGVLGLSYALPNAPGFFGAVQLSLYAGLAVYVSPERVVHQGAALVFLFYAVYLACVVLITLGGLLLEYRSPAPESETMRASRSGPTMEKIQH